MTPRKRKLTPNDGRMMARLLDAYEAEGLDWIHLGAMKGVPHKTRDPEVVERAAVEWDRRADAALNNGSRSKTRALVYRSKAIRLRQDAAQLGSYDDEEARAWFVAHGAAYCEAKGIVYGALREFGLPAALLREAGITRGRN